MQSGPSAHVLVKTVREFLESEVIPATSDQRLRFRARIAANVLGVVERELDFGAELESAEQERVRRLTPGFRPEHGECTPYELMERTVELARRILDREVVTQPGDKIWQHLRATLLADLKVANPGYLQRRGET